MTRDRHFVGREKMYLAAPINKFYHPSIEISNSEATIEIEVVYDAQGNELGRGNGLFVRSRLPLNEPAGYSDVGDG